MSLPAFQDRQGFAGLIVELEERLDVNAIDYDGVKLWPMIRWMLAKEIKGTAIKEGIDDSLEAVRTQSFTGGREERAQLASRQRNYERVENPDPMVQIEDQFKKLRQIGQCDYLVFSKIEKYYQPLGDKFYAPIVDPVYEDLQKRGKTQMIAQEPLDIACVNEPLRLSIDPYMRISSALQKRDTPQELLGWEARINATLDDLSPDYRLDMSTLVKRLNRYRRRVGLFRDILEITRPKAVFFSSFVGWTPLVLAAEQAGTVSVDIQHGGQSAYHYHTTHWTKVPQDGYELLPDIFWVWGEAIKAYIDPWLPGNAYRHRPVVGGHRFVAKWKNRTEAIDLGADQAVLESRLAKAKKIVLVTLGYSVDDILPECLVEALEKTPDWLWLLRMHPINRGQAAIDEICAKTVRRGLSNLEYEVSTRLPLYALLSCADFHVTPFSTTCREARAFGVDSAIIHPIGGTYFSDEIAQGYFAYAETAHDLLRAIVESVDGRQASIPEFIETDHRLVDDVLREVDRVARERRPSHLLRETSSLLARDGSLEPSQSLKGPARVF